MAESIRLEAGERTSLYESLIAADGLRDFVGRFAVWLRAAVVVQSATLELLEMSEDRASSLALDAHHIIAALDADAREYRVRILPAANSLERDRAVAQVSSDGAVAGYVIAELGPRGAVQTCAVLHELRELIRHQLTVRREYERSIVLASQSLLDDLVSGRPGPRIARHAALLGFDLSVRHRVFALGASVRAQGSDTDTLAEVLLKCLRRGVALDARTLIGAVDEDYLLAFVPTSAEIAPHRTAGDLRELASVAGWEVSVGIGPECGEPQQFAAAVRKAVWAAEVARSTRPSRPYVEFDKLGLYGLIQQRDWVVELTRFAQQRLTPLLAHADGRDDVLVVTLREVLRAPNLTEAAANLYIHHSTLRYRLRRIESILGASLDDPDVRFDLDLSLRILLIRQDIGPLSPAINSRRRTAPSGHA